MKTGSGKDEKGPASDGGSLCSRRSFVYGVGGIAVTLGLGGVARLTSEEGSLLHPPGANELRLFTALCIRCDRCRSACPSGVIGVGKLEDGILNARLPKMEFRLGYCDTCDGAYKCIEACSAGALQPFDPARDKIGMAAIDADKCQVFGISATCGKACQKACPADAIVDTAGGRIAVDEEKCWGCGACEYVCPTNAYRTYDGNPSRGINVHALS